MNTQKAIIRKTTNILFNGMGTEQKGWGIFFIYDGQSDERFGFYKTKKAAIADAKEYDIKISKS